ncbi:Phosphodiest-domain-containing protein [Neoconidiobolus thromboides FSU 785]|nr:Phosphodiest-domain-containing protein [Neoconidiobolus thromboides FSU 785]
MVTSYFNGGEQLFPSTLPTYEAVAAEDREVEVDSQLHEEKKLENIRDFFYYFQTLLCIGMLFLIFFSFKTLYVTFTGSLPNLQEMRLMNKYHLNNGTNSYAPTVILISLDGFRADYLNRNITPNLNRLVESGTSPKYMIPSFPSVTFPNHYSIVTGLLPDSHGIVGNTFYDPKLNQTFDYRSLKSNLEPQWWGGEPIWITAEAQNIRSAVHMWPGSDVSHGDIKSTYHEPFNKQFKLNDKVNQILEWLDLPSNLRPSMLAAYIFDVDTNGHDFGPNSKETNEAIKRVDDTIGQLIRGLEMRNLTEIVNLVILSDHGMAEVAVDNIIYLDDYIDMHKILANHIFPLAGLVPKEEKDIDSIYNQLKLATKNSTNWDVYKREDIPSRFKYGKNERVPPIVCIPKKGWIFGTQKVYPHLEELEHVYGIHGYDNLDEDMRALFIGHGPYFKKSVTIPPFQNIEVYNLLTNILGIKPSVNNGTLYLK